MNLTLTEAEETRLAALAQAQGMTLEELVREAIRPILSAVPESPSAIPRVPTQTVSEGQRPIWEVLTERMKNLPPEVFERLPKDGASEHDHYLYGSPKRNP